MVPGMHLKMTQYDYDWCFINTILRQLSWIRLGHRLLYLEHRRYPVPLLPPHALLDNFTRHPYTIPKPPGGGMESMVRKNASGYRIVLFPAPFQGHINPMFHLACLLHSRGFSITILHTNFNSPDPTNYPNYHFVSVPGGLTTSTDDVVALILSLNANYEAPFRAQMSRMRSERSGEPIACVVVDALLYSVQAVAKQLGLPTLVLRTGSAASFYMFAAFPLLWKRGYLPIQDSRLEVQVNELAPLRVRDLLRVEQSNPQKLRQLIEQVVEEARTSSAIIINTFVAIEGNELEKVREELSVPVFPIGPLHKLSPKTESSLMDQDHSCLDWLDKKHPRSVLYVSFGSLASMDGKELAEAAWGLANCQQPFLWVLRPGSIRGSAQIELPQGFEEETRGRGKIVKWAPQQQVLAHPAVGGFWTHNGWNSTVESMSEGIPMLCKPYFSDQMGNARYVSEVWKVGIQLENGLERGEIKSAIKRLMTEKEGDEMKRRARDLKEKAAQCVRKEGSSQVALDRLVDYVLSL
ncbi:UDP-glycosyltransferase 76F1 [Cocos nucifera]|uniref:2,4-dihydroxy-7-methoxy-2H-1,4-benzoxazin-3(4H)-one 2-D-glucosyltransferase n=1 Tax=Cocos nucifera TaxID=13894 RepID=A0A8K0I4P5_COCNU|nr:UDP-glycosyltransferase 76F1 [Cocos nucifera]